MTTTTATSWTVEIPNFLPTPLNELMRMHWAKRNRILKKEYFLIAMQCRWANVPHATGKRRVSQKLTLNRSGRNRDNERDDDGCWKGVLDGLVEAGMLMGDSREWVEKTPVEYEVSDKRKTTIILKDI